VYSVLIIRVERSGGLTGLTILKEMDSKYMPSDLINIAQKIINDKGSNTVPVKKSSSGAADYYSYVISVQDGDDRKIIRCNEYDIRSELKSLVKYIERHSKNHE
jgi:hypothetical protein